MSESILRDTYVSIVGCILLQLVRDCSKTEEVEINAFKSIQVPDINISEYMKYVTHHLQKLSSNAILMSLFWLQRFMHKVSSIKINHWTIHRLQLTLLCCAHKFVDDDIHNNADFALVGGISLKELNYQEVELLCLLNFDLYASLNDFICFYADISSKECHLNCQCRYKDAPPF